MNCEIDQRALAGELTFLAPMLKDLVRLSTVQLTVADSQLTLATFNGHINLRTCTPVTQAAPGVASVYGSHLRAMVSMLPKGAVQLGKRGDRLAVAWKGGSASYPYLAPWLMRPIPDPLTIDITVPTKTIADMLKMAAFATRDDFSSYVPGVLLEVGDCLRLVATDGYSMAVIERPCEPRASSSILLPFITVQALRSMLVGGGDTRLVVSGDDFQATCNGRELQARAAAGKFPDYNRIMPNAGGRCATMHAKDFADVVQRVVLAGADTFGHVDLTFTQDQVRVNCESTHETISCAYTGDMFALRFDAKKLCALVGSITSERVTVFIENLTRPVFQPFGDERVRLVLVPIRRESVAK